MAWWVVRASGVAKISRLTIDIGYGATTLPALTEAITIEKNATLADYEAKRLQSVIDQLTEALLA